MATFRNPRSEDSKEKIDVDEVGKHTFLLCFFLVGEVSSSTMSNGSSCNIPKPYKFKG
jgi:hypothetical protein